MRKTVVIGTVMAILFLMPIADSSFDAAGQISAIDGPLSNLGTLSDGMVTNNGKGAALSVAYQGVFTTNASTWISTGSTYALDLTTGTTYEVRNATTVTWTALVSVSPPAEVTDVGFTVDFNELDWAPQSVTNPLGVVKSTPLDWTYSAGVLRVHSTAIDVYGPWKIEFTSMNHLRDLQLGLNGGSLGKTAIFDIGQQMEFEATASWINGATTELILQDPTGAEWHSDIDTIVTSPTHLLPSFQYRKDITIDQARVSADLTDFPLMMNIDDTGLHDHAQTDGDDIVFVQNGIVLSHEIELYNPTQTATEARLVAWVKANLTASADTIISMYYGNPLVDSQERPEDVWTSNYIGVYHLGEDTTDGQTSGIHEDSTSNDYYGNQGGNDRGAGIAGFSQNFVIADSDMITIDSARGMDPVGDVTISGWFRLNSGFTSSASTSYLIMEKHLGSNIGDNNMHIGLVGTDYGGAAPAGSLVFKVENDNGGVVQRMYKWTNRDSWSASNWFHFVCIMDSTNADNNKIFINGVDETNLTDSGSNYAANLAYTDDWGVGGGFTDGQFPGGQGYFNGRIDEVRVATTNRANTAGWINVEYFSQRYPGTFYEWSSQIERAYEQPNFVKSLTADAAAGLWTATVLYNDTGSSVNNMVGMYQREFVVRHSSALTLESPGDAVGSGVSTKTVGDILYVVVNLEDSADPITGATVSMNWTVPSAVTLEDYGNGRYGIALNTSDLVSARQWRLEIDSTHPYYTDASLFFLVDLYHPTELIYDSLTTTPVGLDSDLSLVYRDTYDGSPISDALFTFANGTAVTPYWSGGGRYNFTISTAALSKGVHTYMFNASHPTAYVEMASAEVAFTIRAHYTAVTVTGDLTVPWGEDTPVTILLVDMDTGLEVPIADVASFTFDSGLGVFSGSYSVTLDTSAWGVATTPVTISVTLSNSNLMAPDDYMFDLVTRAHRTALSVTGVLTIPYGNNTPLTVLVTDLDTGALLTSAEVTSFDLDPATYANQPFDGSSLSVLLSTSTWAVGTETVTLSMILTSNYMAPANYVFQVTIRSMTIYMYHEPSTLRFSTGQDFLVTLRVNVSEPGIYYGNPVTGLIPGEFTVPGYGASIDTTEQAIGRYNLTISAASFADGYHTITVYLNPTNSIYASITLVITFRYEPGIAALSSPNYPQVTTPFETDVQISLIYQDADSLTPITGATIGGNIPTYGQAFAAGVYTIWIDVAGYAKGSYQFTLWADHADFENKTLTFTLVIRDAFTYALPSVGALDIPLGNDLVFTVDYHDIDNDVPVSNGSGDVTVVSSWGNINVEYLAGPGLYQVTFNTVDTDTLVQNLVVTFTFSRPNYQDGAFSIIVTIRTHTTDFRLVSAVEPTSFNGIINISVYYGDVDSNLGITPLGSIGVSVVNESGPVIFSTEVAPQGDGYYIIRISANQFGQGLQTFNVTFSWTGVVEKFQTKWLIATTNVVGEDSRLTLMLASEPTPYGEVMSYTFFYSDLGNVGITNDTNDVHISVTFQGVIVDLGQVTISEVDRILQPGNYSVSFNSTIFGKIGLIYMSVYINWTQGVAPYYTNRFDTISVRVLPRDTLVSIVPPTPTPYGEIAFFNFTFDDVTGGGNVPIGNSSSLSITTSLVDYSLSYNALLKEFTISFNSSDFGALGSQSFTLNVIWYGAPFYANRTGRTVFITVTTRQTVLDFQAPAPTPYLNNVTFIVTWTDVTGTGTRGISGATVNLYNDATPMTLGIDYLVTALGDGGYEIELNTTYFAAPGFYNLVVELTYPEFYFADISAVRTFNVRNRITLLSSDPTDKLPYNSTLQFVVNYQDLLTLGVIGNETGDVTFQILNITDTWLFTISWNAVLQQYDLWIETYNNPWLEIDTPYVLQIQMSYASISPFYDTDTAYISFQLRSRASKLVVEDPPDPTPYLDYANITVFYSDLDGGSVGITAESILVAKGIANLTLGTHYIVTNLGNGHYLVSVNTTSLDGLGLTSITITATWNALTAPYHGDASTTLNVRVTGRETNVEVVTPPTQTQYLDIVTFTIAYIDFARSTAITSIDANDIDVWAGGILLNPVQYSIIQVGSEFNIEINSTVFGGVLVSNYNVTVIVDVDNGLAPYYFDDSTMVRVTTTNRIITYAPNPLSEAPFGSTLTISFFLEDSSTGSPVQGAIIAFDCQTVSLTAGTDFTVTEGTGINVGKYTIDINTTALLDPGTFLFDLDISWNPLNEPYYANLATIAVTGKVGEIPTTLNLWAPDGLIEVNWRQGANVYVNYTDFLSGANIPGAVGTINWTWPAVGISGGFSEPVPGVYLATIDTSLGNARTYVITITAKVDRYQRATTFITIIVKSLPSDLVPITPADPVIILPRGAEVEITVYLRDISFGTYIHDDYVNSVVATFEGVDYPMFYNGTPGYYSTAIPENGPTNLPTGVLYGVRITTSLVNYDPTAYLFNIFVQATETEIELYNTSDEIITVYSQILNLTVRLVAPDLSNVTYTHTLNGSTLVWVLAEQSLAGSFTEIGNGYYYVLFNTTEVGYGIWGLSLRANHTGPFSSTSRQLILTINRIQTTAFRPASLDLVWGWSGYINFTFWDESFDEGVVGANANFTLPGLPATPAIDFGGGIYQVFLDTSLLTPSPSPFPLTITFVKPNYQEASETLLIRVIEVPTDISVFVPEVNSNVDHPFEYIVPYGEVLNITVFYNDTDASEGITGGLVGAQLNLSSIYGPTRALSSFEMVSLGGGYYYFLFNTLDSWLFEQAVGDPGPQTSPFRLTLILDLENRSHASQVIDIWIIELPTSIEIVEMNTNLLYGDTGRLVVMYLDAWPGHPEGTLISGASFTLDIDTAVTELLGFSDPYEDPARPGYYIVEYTAASPFIGTDTGVSDVTFILSIANTEPQLVTLRVVVQPTQTAQLLTTAFSYGLPLAFVVIFLLVGYIRVWSIPKHLRRINAMIKDLRKGKIPKPVSAAQSRQELIAGLFNDTFAELSIKRTPDQMPPDSIPIEVPEMGELLVQLSILTNLSSEELDEFKADIAKMRISEQAAFVREVIMQEAIRAARREGKTVDEILEELRVQSSRRLGDEEDEILPDTEDEVHEEPVILRPDDVDSVEYFVKDAPDEDMSFSSDYLSPFEIEELQVELTRRGIPLQEIDIILEQARTLPRDLVEELIRSIGEEED